MKKIFKRLVIGLIFALPLMVITYAIALASGPAQDVPTDPDCASCHAAFVEAWGNSLHGHATTDAAFNESWLEQGQPPECLECHTTGYDPETGTYKAEGITCEACHSPYTAEHPLAPMPMDRSAELCGKCHTETHFEWQVSMHREEGVDCVACHDPHKTGLKMESQQMLCSSCHRSRASNYAHTAHSKQGLSCTDCHLSQITESPIEGHSKQDHSFFVSLETCNTCHSFQMHDPGAVHLDNPTPEPVDTMSSVQTETVQSEPVPVSPIGFTAMSGLIGVAFGIVAAPWLEKWQNGKKSK
jgi:predicted CXXCH cytochrome family protein